MSTALGAVLLGPHPRAGAPAPWPVEVADARGIAAHRRLRRAVFVDEQGLFASPADENDAVDDDPRTVVLVARGEDGEVLAGVRLAPSGQHLSGGRDVGWWAGSRLVVARGARRAGGAGGAGPALVRAACAHAEAAGALRFDATVQVANEALFVRLGWHRVRDVTVAGAPHVLMRWPVGRVQALVEATKAPLGALLHAMTSSHGTEDPDSTDSTEDPDGTHGTGTTGALPSGSLGGPGFVGDDAAPVPGSDLLASCDAIIASMVERDPEWAGWCGVLAGVNDLAAMGATPVGLLDSVAARDSSFAARILSGLTRAAAAYGVPVLGGHTSLGVPAALSVTALGRATAPVRAGGGAPGMTVSLSADTCGGWRRGHTGRQWDSTTTRTPQELRAMLTTVAATRPAAAKDVSMAGTVGTLAMLAEASGCGAVLDVAAVPRPADPSVSTGDWLTCFPGSAWLSASPAGCGASGTRGSGVADVGVPGFVSAACGELVSGRGVALRWPDGELTVAVAAGATGLGSSWTGGAA